VIGGEPQFKPGSELEPLVVEEPGGHPIAAGSLFDEPFSQVPFVFRFDNRNESGTGEAGNVTGDTRPFFCEINVSDGHCFA
jgi:hypothetical protein